VAYEAGRDGFWLARWLQARGVECRVIHPTSTLVSREHRRAKTTGSMWVCSSARFWGGCGVREALQHGGGADA
jgi:NAD(P)H-hydrate repair Nnr-like enzyme with NAD(P)H-hydrate epimerase domain